MRLNVYGKDSRVSVVVRVDLVVIVSLGGRGIIVVGRIRLVGSWYG